MPGHWNVIDGDCVEQMAMMDEASVEAVVCDPPYGLEFMGKDWDRLGAVALHDPSEVGGFQDGAGGNAFSRSRVRFGATAKAMQEWHEAWAREAFRVLRPGGHLLAFGGTRTSHRLACAIEDAGFEIRDTIAWMYGSGFPKSLQPRNGMLSLPRSTRREDYARWWHDVRTTATGTALKPSHEPIVVARKPPAGTVAGNVLAHGTGALNVDGCRIGSESTTRERTPDDFGLVNDDGWKPTPGVNGSEAGRWPANVVLDPEAAAMLDEQTGESTSGAPRDERGRGGIWTPSADGIPAGPQYGDSGGASRFFYCAKSSSAERNAGLDGFEAQGVHRYGAGIGEGLDPNAPSIDRNVHPTVKPIALMRWLVRLVTPPSGTVLDPFTGSGTTGCAAMLEGFRFVGIERDAEYTAIARARIAWWAEHPEGMELIARLEHEAERKRVAESGQLGLFG